MLVEKRLQVWSESRGITAQKHVKLDFIANVTDELGEYLVATKQKDANDTIDAVADIAVFCITEIYKSGFALKEEYTNLINKPTFSEFIKTNLGEDITTDNLTRNEFNGAIVGLLGGYYNEDIKGAYAHLVVINELLNKCFSHMISLGYNIYLVMDEVTKVLESREGKWDEANGKFQKDMSFAAQANWYTPEYEECLLCVG